MLMVLIAVAMAVPKWIGAWKARQEAPIREAIAAYHFQGGATTTRQADGSYAICDLFGEQLYLGEKSIAPIGFFEAEADGGFGLTGNGPNSGAGMHYLLKRQDGKWIVRDATVVSIGCGVGGAYPDAVWTRTLELIHVLRTGDAVNRRRACATLSGLAVQARRENQPRQQLSAIMEALQLAREDTDPEIRRTAEAAL
jgi:hypothetical protein